MSYTAIGEALFFLVGLPLFAFQSVELLQALIDFLMDWSQNIK